MNIFFRSIFILLFSLIPVFAMAEVNSAGIPKDLIWFSKSPFYAGDTVNVYTIVYNSTPYQFTGVMQLRDGSRVLGKQEFIIGPSGASEVVAIPWGVSLGSHDLSMLVTSGAFTFNGKTVSNAGIPHVQSGQVELFTELPPASERVPQTTPSPSSASSSLISSIGVQVAERIPTPLVSTAVPMLGHLEQFRVAQAVSAAQIIHNAERAIIQGAGIEAEHIATSSAPRLDKWGGVIDPKTSGASTIKTKSQMKGWDLILHGTSSADVVRTPLQYVKLFFALIFSFIITHAMLFYIVLLLLIYKIIRIVLGIFF